MDSVILEFVEACVQQVLWVREVYSRELFERCRLYGVSLFRSRHPQLNDYIHQTVQSLR
jgi:mitotic spindle assembly checkpoint protein MAD2B